MGTMRFLSVLTAAAMTASCALLPGSVSVSGVIDKLNIAGAKAIFITGGPGGSPYRTQGTNDGPGLYRLNQDHSITKVKPVDQGGKDHDDALIPHALEVVNADYLWLTLTNKPGVVTSADDPRMKLTGNYLVRRSDGKSVQLNDLSRPKADGRGNLYAVRFGNMNLKTSLVKLTPGSGDTFAISELTNPEIEEVSNPAVDRDGNLLATVRIKGPNPEGKLRLYKASGGAQILDSSPNLNYWAGRNGKLYYTTSGAMGNARQVSVTADGRVIIEDVKEGEYPPNGSLEVEMADRWLVTGSGIATLTSVTDTEIRSHRLTQVQQIQDLKASGTHAYVLGKSPHGTNALIRFTPTTGDETVLLSDGDYEVTAFSVGRDDEPTLYALRISDSAYVMGTIGSDGQFIIRNTSLPQRLTHIVHLQ